MTSPPPRSTLGRGPLPGGPGGNHGHGISKQERRAGGAGIGVKRRPLLHIPPGRLATRHERRINRQLEFIARLVPALERPMRAVLRPSLWPMRLPVALLLALGGLFSFLPVLGLWMLPLGLLLLAVDVPFLRPTIGWATVRSRRWFSNWRRSRRNGKDQHGL